jgi:hypothetical protein
MTALRTIGVAWIVIIAASFGAARAGQLPGSSLSTDPFTTTFDEDLSGTYRANGGPTTPLTGSLQPDPLNGGTLVPTFVLPEPVLAGDVLITDHGSSTLSDLLRFPDNGGGIATVMMYYSLIPSTGTPSASDVGIPSTFQPNHVTIDESLGQPGNDGFIYNAGGNVFHGISDFTPVPEPASSTLLVCGFTLLLIKQARRRLARA